MPSLKLCVISGAVVGLGMLLGASSYESVVMAPNYAAQVPQSLEHIRSFFVTTTPQNFFRVLAPITQLLLVIGCILTWRMRKVRWWMVGALGTLLMADVITFSFHYPLNELMFLQPLAEVPVEKLTEAAQQWGPGNHVRVVLILVATACAITGLIKTAKENFARP